MTRRVITTNDVAIIEELNKVEQATKLGSGDASAPREVPKPDSYEKKLLLLVPADVVAVFIAIDGVIRAAAAGLVHPIGYWAVFAVLVVGTYFYVLRTAADPAKLLPDPIRQAVIAALAFIVWVFALGGPFSYDATMSWYNPVFGAILLPLFTFLIPLAMPASRQGK